MDRYREMVGKLYREPDSPIIVGSFLELEEEPVHPVARARKVQKKKSHDIRFFLFSAGSGPSGLTEDQKRTITRKNTVVEIDSD